MIIGYTRVSTRKQNLESQQEEVKKFGVDKLYEEKASGRNTERPILKEVIDYLRPGDTLVIYDLSRLGRTVHQVMKLVDFFSSNNIGFVSLKENMDISTPVGKAMLSIIASFNQMKVEIQNEKIKAGLDNVKSKGNKLGRKPISKDKASLIQALSKQGYTNRKITDHLKISIRTVLNYKNI